MTKMRIVTALAAVLCAGSVAAQNPAGTPDRIVLEAKAGSVMASSGGEYQTANHGKRLSVGESLMLGEGANATVVYYYTDAYGDVVRKCSERYVGANTYVVDDVCAASAAAWAGARNSGAGWIIGAALVGAAIIESMGDEPVGPLSTGPNGQIRHF